MKNVKSPIRQSQPALQQRSRPLLPVSWLRKINFVYSSLEEEAEVTRGAIFRGDIPINHRCPVIGIIKQAEDNQDQVNFVGALNYVQDRPKKCFYHNVYYTPKGFALINGRINTALSARRPFSSKELVKEATKLRALTLECGTIIESQSPNTYGDWTVEHLRSIALCPTFPHPLVLPSDIASRDYVVRDLNRLGVTFIAADRKIHIREAHVLHKPRPGSALMRSDVEAYRKLFGIRPPQSRAGSLLYLSRVNVKSDQNAAVREFPSEIIANVIRALGGRVVETGRLTPEDYASIAGDAETVVADHGAAALNILQWNTKNLLEIVTDNWWGNSMVFAGRACGVINHAVVCCNRYDADELAKKIEQKLRDFSMSF